MSDLVVTSASAPAPGLAAWKRFGLFAAVLAGAFAWPLWQWGRFALGSETFSYVLMVPAISFYLGWINRDVLLERHGPASRLAAVPALAGAVFLAAGIWGRGRFAGPDDHLTWLMLAFVCFVIAGGLVFLGAAGARAAAFPAGFLFGMAPFTEPVTAAVQHFLKLASAEPTAWFLLASGVPFLRDGNVFHLPGISIEVAEECSGIRSTLVLTVTALLAAYLLLKRGWTRLVLVGLSLPLGIVRNGFRVFVVSWLCVTIDPSMINSFIHRRGGPVFFGLSLIPLFVLAHVLRRCETRAPDSKSKAK